FSQAEDGIRDFHVTGVQTCALPISAQQQDVGVQTGLASRGPRLRRRRGELLLPAPAPDRRRPRPGADAVDGGGAAALAPSGATRSEERRVGQERRARGSAGPATREE